MGRFRKLAYPTQSVRPVNFADVIRTRKKKRAARPGDPPYDPELTGQFLTFQVPSGLRQAVP